MFDGSFHLNTKSTQILSVHVHNNGAPLLGGQGAQLWGPGKSPELRNHTVQVQIVSQICGQSTPFFSYKSLNHKLETRLSVSNGGSWVKMTLPCTQGFRYEAENARKWLATDTDWMILATINSRLLICMRRSGKAAPGWSWRCGSRGCWDCEGGNWDGHLCIVFCRQSMAQALVVVLLVVFTSANP